MRQELIAQLGAKSEGVGVSESGRIFDVECAAGEDQFHADKAAGASARKEVEKEASYHGRIRAQTVIDSSAERVIPGSGAVVCVRAEEFDAEYAARVSRLIGDEF